MEKERCNFIITKDEEARKILLSYGLFEVKNVDGDVFLFVNNPKKLTFNYDELPITFTNTLYF